MYDNARGHFSPFSRFELAASVNSDIITKVYTRTRTWLLATCTIHWICANVICIKLLLTYLLAINTRRSATAKSTARPSCLSLVGVWHFSGDNLLMANQPLVRNGLWDMADIGQIFASKRDSFTLTPPLRWFSADIAISVIPLKTTLFGLHFKNRKYPCIVNHFYVMGPES